MKSGIRGVLSAASVLLTLTAFALPAAAHGGGPALYCEAGTFDNCTDTGDVATAVDFFSCDGQAGVAASCYDRTTGETSPYCAFQAYEPDKNLDYYLCGSEPTQ